jgi:C-terminal processing protease CtpA/Prc
METRDGVRIRQVLFGSPAEKAGLRTGDLVLSIDDERVRSAQDIEQTIRQKDPGAWIDLEIWRNGRRETIEARLASRQRAIGDAQQFGSRQALPQQPQFSRQPQFQDSSMQQLAQQIQSLQQQLAQLRQEVSQMRSERQVLRPSYEDRGPPGQRNNSSNSPRSNDRSLQNQDQFDD